ncbi:Transglycosylase SLT domain-containing protein [Sulfitobacter marinus]|uniref:Transglycosylase SLT domain-containing protein n=1 Tax=Sulfitobacter marinus TaxID=394264 RepID=A0A1I6V4G1_9RHOB|nr:lytic transglycosylase domain-containing protein [Sulfitobacter marinus]SFT08583.1 Transglycosylase SLT domain-containing protein [Sulfitobacter marinus]
MKRARSFTCAGLLALLLGNAAAADGWARFYRLTPKPTVESAISTRPAQGDGMGICIREILAAQTRHGIPDNLLLAIGLQEAGTRRGGHFTVWPFAVNAAGTGRLFDTRAAAVEWVASQQRAGVASIDVGCMQINLRWHPDAFATADQGFDPHVNVDYAARFLKRLYKRTGDWMQAAGAYHSFEPEYRDAYLSRLQKNISAANVGLPRFVALANATGSYHDVPRAVVPREPAGRVTVARGTWGAQLGGDANARSSLYSAQDIQPVLPQFTIMTSETTG